MALKGNALYKTENTSKLLTPMEVLKKNQHSSELYFNLGTVIIN
jgi:hypothetical protein